MTQQKMTPVRILFIIAAATEAMLAIPFVSWLTVVNLSGSPLFVALGIHIAALLLAPREPFLKTAPLMGIFASVVGWIPIISWVPHALAAIFYIFTLMTPPKPEEDGEDKKKVEENIRDAEIVEESPVIVVGK